MAAVMARVVVHMRNFEGIVGHFSSSVHFNQISHANSFDLSNLGIAETSSRSFVPKSISISTLLELFQDDYGEESSHVLVFVVVLVFQHQSNERIDVVYVSVVCLQEKSSSIVAGDVLEAFDWVDATNHFVAAVEGIEIFIEMELSQTIVVGNSSFSAAEDVGSFNVQVKTSSVSSSNVENDVSHEISHSVIVCLSVLVNCTLQRVGSSNSSEGLEDTVGSFLMRNSQSSSNRCKRTVVVEYQIGGKVHLIVSKSVSSNCISSCNDRIG